MYIRKMFRAYFSINFFISNHNDIGLQVNTEKGKNLKVEVHSISFHGKNEGLNNMNMHA